MILSLISVLNLFAFLLMERKVKAAEFPKEVNQEALKSSIIHVVVWCFMLSQIAILTGFAIKAYLAI